MNIHFTLRTSAAALLLAAMLAGCGNSGSSSEGSAVSPNPTTAATATTATATTAATPNTATLEVVTSFYPLYDFAKKIGGDRVHVVNAVPTGVEPHDWAPKSRDISAIHHADLFIYLGSGFESWVEKTLESAPKDAAVKPIEAGKGTTVIESEEAHGDGHGHDEERDPHVWLSPANAKKMAENIKNGMVQADAAHQAEYEANFKKLSDRLDQLDATYRQALAQTTRKEIVVSHQAFAYLCKEYGLTEMPISGLTPDAEPTAKTMKKIHDFVKEKQVKVIFFEELVSDKLAKTLASDAKIETLVLNPLEGLTDAEMKAGDDYFSIMEKNLQNLLKALQ